MSSVSSQGATTISSGVMPLAVRLRISETVSDRVLGDRLRRLRLGAESLASVPEVVGPLPAKPEVRAVAAEPAQPSRHLGVHRRRSFDVPRDLHLVPGLLQGGRTEPDWHPEAFEALLELKA